MPEKKVKSLSEKLQDVKNSIIANSKDAKWAKDLLGELTSLQQQIDVVPQELEVPVASVRDTLDFDAMKIQECEAGYLVTAKGGMQTFVHRRMTAVIEMLEQVFKVQREMLPQATDESRKQYESFVSAVLYVFQAPIFASINATGLYEIATEIVRSFNDYAERQMAAAKPSIETKEDVEGNILQENFEKAVGMIAEEAPETEE